MSEKNGEVFENKEEKIFTIEELSQFDGKDGRLAYIAINGLVYDISSVNLLKNGKHHGVTPGNDVTSLFVHDIKILNRVKVVGTLK